MKPWEIAAVPASLYVLLRAHYDILNTPPPLPTDDEQEDGIDVDKLIDSGHILGDIGADTERD